MFEDCSSLTSLDLSNFKTENVQSMNSMFEDCSSLTSLDLSNFSFRSSYTIYHHFLYNVKNCRIKINENIKSYIEPLLQNENEIIIN